MMKRILAATLVFAVLTIGAAPCSARPTDDEIREFIKPYYYKCDSLDGNYIIAEETRYSSNNVDSAYSVYIVYDMGGNVVVPLGEKSWAELGWEGYVRPSTFRDVASGYGEGAHWARGNIWTLAAYGVVSGYPGGYFYPDKTITRAEFLKLIALIVKEKYVIPEDLSTDFQDVNNTDWYAGYIAWAVKNKIIEGYPDGKFYPNKEITREEMAVIAHNAIEALGLTFPRAQMADAIDFADSAEIADWSKTAINDMSEFKFINGDENKRFLPKKEATRAEAVTIITQMYCDIYEPEDRWL
ncbi:MAG: S-layer homology domain-containing protein [Bacillota bacterium]|nr:S-layer homology domain-containing protein [Bacillota bacterium]